MRSCLLAATLGGCAAAEVPWDATEDVADRLAVIATRADGLARPQDLAFDPGDPGTLWVVNRRDDSVTLVFDAAGDDPVTRHVVDPYALHFMDAVTSIAFGAPGTFGTCQDSRNTYGGRAPANDFMGPTLWSSDLEVFGVSNPEAVDFLTDAHGMPVDLGSHLDMLHQSPLCVGIAWQEHNVYWVFDGKDGALVRYDFHADHGPGYDDHSDGVMARYVRGEVERVAGTVAHLAYDPDTRELFAADPGHGRVVVLDTISGERGSDLSVREPGTVHYQVDGADLGVVSSAFERPAGLALVGDHLVVTDAGTGEVVILTRDGRTLARLHTGLGDGALAGVWAEALDDLWLVDAEGSRVLRLRP